MIRLPLLAGAAVLVALPAFAFNAAPPKPAFDATAGAYLECAIVRLMPASAAGRDPVYKVNINLTYDQNRMFQSLDVSHTLVSGRSVDRSQQYTDGTTWTSMPKTYDWFWQGKRGTSRMLGHLYHNERDGWMYVEDLFESGRYTMQSVADCHEARGARVTDANEQAALNSVFVLLTAISLANSDLLSTVAAEETLGVSQVTFVTSPRWYVINRAALDGDVLIFRKYSFSVINGDIGGIEKTKNIFDFGCQRNRYSDYLVFHLPSCG